MSSMFVCEKECVGGRKSVWGVSVRVCEGVCVNVCVSIVSMCVCVNKSEFITACKDYM